MQDAELAPLWSGEGHVHSAYNLSFSACVFSRNNIFLSQQISQRCFSVGLSAQSNGFEVFDFVAASNDRPADLNDVHGYANVKPITLLAT
jgi:hypothetical protein